MCLVLILYDDLCYQQDEVSEDMMTFHEKVNHMQELEEQIQDDHRVLIDVSQPMWIPYSRTCTCAIQILYGQYMVVFTFASETDVFVALCEKKTLPS